jgi:hypothetical protein
MAASEEGKKRGKQGKIVLTISSAGGGIYDRDAAYHTIYLNPAVKIPSAQYVSAKLVSASVWNSVPNIFTGKNDTLSVDIKDPEVFPTEPNNTRQYQFVLAQGQYSFDDLVKALTRSFVSEGLRADTVTFTADLSSGYCYFSTSYSGGVILNSNSRSIGKVFGLETSTNFTIPVAPTLARAPSPAAFNNINTFVLHSSIAAPGMPINGRTNNILGVVPITVKPNRLVNYTPAYPIEVNAENLQSSQISQVVSYWTTEDGTTPAPMYEDFTYTVELSYFS